MFVRPLRGSARSRCSHSSTSTARCQSLALGRLRRKRGAGQPVSWHSRLRSSMPISRRPATAAWFAQREPSRCRTSMRTSLIPQTPHGPSGRCPRHLRTAQPGQRPARGAVVGRVHRSHATGVKGPWFRSARVRRWRRITVTGVTVSRETWPSFHPSRKTPKHSMGRHLPACGKHHTPRRTALPYRIAASSFETRYRPV